MEVKLKQNNITLDYTTIYLSLQILPNILTLVTIGKQNQKVQSAAKRKERKKKKKYIQSQREVNLFSTDSLHFE